MAEVATRRRRRRFQQLSRGKHADAAKVRIVVAAVLAAGADAVLVAYRLPIPGAHLVTAQPAEEVA